MTTIDERLNKIQKKGAQIVAEAQSEEERKKNIIAQYEKDIKALAPRIKELIEIAAALMKNGIALGEKTKDFIGYKEDLETDGWSHKLGFYLEHKSGHKYLIGVGIKGGGCCGHDLAVDGNGTMVMHPNPNYQSYQYYGYNDYCRKCKQFLENFDNFEKRVNAFVDNL